MKRADFVKIIKLRSIWKIDHRRGDYELPNGSRLSDYVRRLVVSQLNLDNLGIEEDGNISECYERRNEDDKFLRYDLYTMTSEEYCSYEDMEKRIDDLVREIVCG